MSAFVAILKEKSITVATDSRLGINISTGESGQIDGFRKLVPLGDDRVLLQGSAGGTFRPESHPELMEDLSTLSVSESIERLTRWREDQEEAPWLYVAGFEKLTPAIGSINAEGAEVMEQKNVVSAVGMEALVNRLWRPVLYPDKEGGRVGREDFIDMPVNIKASDLSVPEALDCAVFLVRTAGKYTEFLSGDDRERALGDVNVTLNEDGRGERTIGGPIQTCTILRDGVDIARKFHTFGDPRVSIHASIEDPC